MNAVKEFVVPAAVLTVICLVVSAVLAGTYQVTKPVIEAAKRAEADASRVVVLPDGKDFEEVSASGLENIVDAYKAGNGAGYVITGKAKGYGGDLQVMAGIDKDGKIAGVKLMDNNETQGIGSKTGEDSYTSQYKGKDSTLDGVTTISGATISSKAFQSAVTSIFQAYGSLAGVEVAAPEAEDYKATVFPDVTDFSEITVDGAKAAYKAGDAGYVLVMESKGWEHATSPMEVFVGIGNDGKSAGVVVGENSETPPVSDVLKPEYLSKFIGKDSPDGIDNVSGASQTSVGIKKAVRAAMELAPGLIGDAAPSEGGDAPAEGDVPAGDLFTTTTTAKGYGQSGEVSVTVSIDAEGKIASISVDASSETTGLGTQAQDAAYTDTWKGLGEGEAPAAISGATVTSNAVQEAVAKAFAAYNASKGA